MKALIKNKLIICLTIHLLSFVFSYSQHNNAVNELNVKNGIITYFQHNISSNHLQGKDFFKPYLAYIDKNQVAKNHLMDSFILIDQFFHYVPDTNNSDNNYNGIYKIEDLDYYTKNIFKRAFSPIIKENSNNNHSAILNNIKSSTLSYIVFIENDSDSLNLSFDLKFGRDYMYNRDYEILIGWEFFDENNNQLTINSEYELSFSEWYKFYFKILKINIDQTISQSIPIPENIINEVHKVKFHIMNYDTNPVELEIDNVFLTSKNNNLIDLSDTTFDLDYDEMNTNWQFRNLFDTNEKKYLFDDRNPLIQQIHLATKDLEQINLPTIKIIPTLPDFDIEYYTEKENLETLYKFIQYFFADINTQFQNWKKQNPDSKIEIAGIYISNEYIPNQIAEKVSPILEFIKNEIDRYNWELYGSPYMIFNNDKTVESTYTDNVYQYFDLLWQQPNVFFEHFSRGNIDRDLLILANELIQEKNLNVNIESNLPNPDETYGRVIDYFTYGEKYGFINQSKIYYDEAGGYYLSATSENPTYRGVYEKLYDFIKKSRYGVVINGKFETINHNKLNGWKGNYTFTNNGLDKLINNSYEIELFSNKTKTSEFIYLKEKQEYILNFSSDNEDSISTTIQFYNKQGKYINEISFKNDRNFAFTTPNNASGIIIKITNASPKFNSIYDLNIYSCSDLEKIKLFSDRNFKNIIRSAPLYEFGNFSVNLDYSQYLESINKIPVQNNEKYLLSISYKENLPVPQFHELPKAFLGIETFNTNGEKINISFSNDFSFNNNLDMQTAELKNFKTIWSKTTYEFNFPKEIASIKIHLINNQYNNQLVFDNLTFENSNSSHADAINNNILENKNWTDLLPLSITRQSPAFYKEFIPVNGKRKFEFKALVNDQGNSFQPNINLNIEYFDGEFKPISYQFSNFNNHTSHKSKIQFMPETKNLLENRRVNKKWYNNNWKFFTVEFQTPNQVKYIKISLSTPYETGSKISVLTPYLKALE